MWGISATIGNLEAAKEVLLSPVSAANDTIIVKAKLSKITEVRSVIPPEIEKYPWAGHLGIRLAQQIVDIIESSNTTLVLSTPGA